MDFITIMILVCQLNASKLVCFEKGSSNLRASEVKVSKTVTYYKCTNKKYDDCDMDYKVDGCRFTMKDGAIIYSSYACQ